MLKEDWDALAKRLGYEDEKTMFVDLYEVQGISVIELGDRLGFTRGTIARRVGLLGIVKRSRGGANNDFPQRLRLWRLDQRLVHCFPRAAICQLVEVSSVTLQAYISSCTEVKEKENVDVRSING